MVERGRGRGDKIAPKAESQEEENVVQAKGGRVRGGGRFRGGWYRSATKTRGKSLSPRKRVSSSTATMASFSCTLAPWMNGVMGEENNSLTAFSMCRISTTTRPPSTAAAPPLVGVFGAATTAIAAAAAAAALDDDEATAARLPPPDDNGAVAEISAGGCSASATSTARRQICRARRASPDRAATCHGGHDITIQIQKDEVLKDWEDIFDLG